jgi:ubiquinone/menaquinone biosynthesis C-methylase UbiE
MSREKEQALIPNYDAKLDYYSPANDRELPKIMQLVGAPMSGNMLDVGCGDGRASEWGSMTYLGIDYSGERIKHAKVLYPDQEFKQGDLYEELPKLPKETYDLVWCCELLEHLEEPAIIWEEMKRLCSRMVVCTVPVNMPHKNHLQLFKTESDLSIFDKQGEIEEIHRVHCRTQGGRQREHFVFTFERTEE